MKHRILLIEDTIELGEILQEILLMEGFETVWERNPVKGLAQFDSMSPNLVITDWVMTEMDGLGVIRNIREKFKATQLPIIVLSAKASPDDEALAYKTGGSLFLKKPCDSNVLIDSVKRLLKNGN